MKLWKKRLVLLLTIALLGSEAGSYAMVAHAANGTAAISEEADNESGETEQTKEKERLPIPEEYITFGEETPDAGSDEKDIPDQAGAQNIPAEGFEDEIPIITPDSLVEQKESSQSGEQSAQINPDTESPDAAAMEGGLAEETENQETAMISEAVDSAKYSDPLDVSTISANAIELDTIYSIATTDVNQLGNQYMTLTPQESGYYSVVSQTNTDFITAVVYSETGEWMDCGKFRQNTPFSTYLEAGKTYIMMFEDQYIPVSELCYRVTKAQELTLNASNFASGSIEDVAVVVVEPGCLGEVGVSIFTDWTPTYSYNVNIRTDKGFMYQPNQSGSSIYKYTAKEQAIVTILNIGEEATDYEIAVCFVPYQTYDASVTSAVIEPATLYYDKWKIDDSVSYDTCKSAFVKYTPSETGEYVAVAERNVGSIKCYSSQTDDLGDAYMGIWMAEGYSVPGFSVELEAGQTYIFELQLPYGSPDTSAMLAIRRQDRKQIEVGTEYTLDVTEGLVVSAPAEAGTFYRYYIKSNETNKNFTAGVINGQCMSDNVDYYATERANVVYAQKDKVEILIARDLLGDSNGKLTVKLEKYQPQVLEETKVSGNDRVLLPDERYVVAFTPKETKTYTFYGAEYLDSPGINISLYETEVGNFIENGSIVERKYLQEKSSVTGTTTFTEYDEFQIQYLLEAGKTYYLYVSSYNFLFEKIHPGDILAGVEESKEYTYTFSDVNKKAEWNIPLNYGATLKINIPETGFYAVNVSGDADSYRFRDGYNSPFTVYNEQEKTFFARHSDSYTLQIAREFKVDSKTDNLTVTIEKKDVSAIPLFSGQNNQTLDLTLREQGDYAWSSFTANEAGYYTLESIYPNGAYDEDTDESIWTSTMLYCIGDSTLQLLETDYGSRISLEAGETIYAKTMAQGSRGEVSLRMVPYKTVNLVEDQLQTIQTDTGYAVLNVDLKESGIYSLDFVQKDDEEYEIPGFGTLYESGSLKAFRSKGEQQIFIMPQQTGSREYGVKLSKAEVYDSAMLIPVEGTSCKVWVKYVADKTERKVIGVDNPNANSESDFNIYKVVTDSCMENVGNSEYSDGWGCYGVADFLEGETYYISVSVYAYYFYYEENELTKPLTMYVESVPQYAPQLGETIAVDMSRMAYVNLAKSQYAPGWYEFSVEGIDGSYCVDIGSDEVYISKDGTYYLYNRVRRNEIPVEVRRTNGREQGEFAMTIRAYQPVAKEIKLNEEISKTASNFECYSFRVPKGGKYYLESKGIEEYRVLVNEQQGYGTLPIWYSYDTMVLNEGDLVTLYAANQGGDNYTLKVYEVANKYVFDYDEYQAFIASGGSVTLKNEADISQEEWEDYWDENLQMYYHDDNTQLVISNKNFKNQNQLWLLECIDWDAYDVSLTTYDYFQTVYEEWYGKRFLGFFKTNGQKAAATDVIVPAYMLLAKFRPEFVWVQEIRIQGVNALKVGASARLTAVLDTKNQYEPTNPQVTWSSSDSSVVSVDQTGTMTANKEGKATITVRSNDRLKRSASLEVTVSQDVVYVSKVVISGDNQVYVGDEIQLTATLDTEGKGKPSRDGVTWSSSDVNVATVDQTGKVTGICEGTAVITAASNDGKAAATYTVTVKNVEETKISLNESSITVKKGTTYKWLTVTFKPENTTIKTLTWKSDNTKVATVNSKGVITAKGVGKATITVTSRNGKKDTVKVTVTKDAIKMKKISIPSKESLFEGDTVKLEVEVTPVNTTNQKVKWTSSNEEVATVSSKGVVTGKKAGKATITVTAQDGTKKSDKCVITVKELSKVDDLKVSSKSKKTVEITWKEVEDADGYNIYMADSKNGKYQKIGSTKAGVTTFTKKKLTSKKKYYFKVVAYRKAGKKTYEGKFSSVKNVKVK